jgi:hypothetical protein
MRSQEQVGTGAKYHNLKKDSTPPTLGGLFLSNINNYNEPANIEEYVFKYAIRRIRNLMEGLEQVVKLRILLVYLPYYSVSDVNRDKENSSNNY